MLIKKIKLGGLRCIKKKKMCFYRQVSGNVVCWLLRSAQQKDRVTFSNVRQTTTAFTLFSAVPMSRPPAADGACSFAFACQKFGTLQKISTISCLISSRISNKVQINQNVFLACWNSSEWRKFPSDCMEHHFDMHVLAQGSGTFLAKGAMKPTYF